MAAFVNGGGDLGSDTLEQAFLEVVRRTLVLDNAQTTPTGNLVYDEVTGTGTALVTATLPVTTTMSAGKLVFSPTNFLGSTVFDPGTGTGALVATTYPEAIVEVAGMIQVKEIAQTVADPSVNITVDSDAATMTITGNFALTQTITVEGKFQAYATAYLT